MSNTRRFLICDSLAHAAVLDQFALAYMADMRGVQAAEWSGVWAKPGDPADTYAVEWESPLVELLGPITDPDTGAALLPIVAAVEAANPDGSRSIDWERLPPPEPPGFP